MQEEALEARVKDLEKQLSNITFQRDELQRDVESLCMQGSMGSTFSASSVLSDRIITSENELAKVSCSSLHLVFHNQTLTTIPLRTLHHITPHPSPF